MGKKKEKKGILATTSCSVVTCINHPAHGIGQITRASANVECFVPKVVDVISVDSGCIAKTGCGRNPIVKCDNFKGDDSMWSTT